MNTFYTIIGRALLFVFFSFMAHASEAGKTMPFNYKTQNDAFWAQALQGELLQVCRYHATEKPKSGQYDEFYETGTYYCACCGGDHALFSSEAKFDSGTGWPSFYEPLPDAITLRPDPDDKVRGYFGHARTEVLCSRCGSHLGHVFHDGPPPTGDRYCMNSITLIFVPQGEQPKRTFEIDETP